MSHGFILCNKHKNIFLKIIEDFKNGKSSTQVREVGMSSRLRSAPGSS